MKNKKKKIIILKLNESRKKKKKADSIRPSKPEMELRIKNGIETIKNQYSYDKCLALYESSDEDRDSLYELLNGIGVNGLTVCNLDAKACEYRCKKYAAYDFMCDVEALCSELSREFGEIGEFIIYGHIENGGKEK